MFQWGGGVMAARARIGARARNALCAIFQAVHLVDAQHEGARARLGGGAEGVAIHLVQRAQGDARILRVARGLLVVRKVVLYANAEVSAVLHTPHHRGHRRRGEDGVLAVVLPQAPIEGDARNVGSRTQHHIDALCKVLPPHGAAKGVQQLGVPRLRNGERGGEGGDAAHAIPNALRAVLQRVLRDAQAGDCGQRPSVRGLAAAL